MGSGVYPRKTLEERFWEAVIKADHGCWGWKRSKHKFGYGVIGNNWKVRTAHRVSWELHYGPIPQGMEVMHKCDNPPCCNPEHLILGTHAENSSDMARKKRGTAKFDADQIKGIRFLRQSGLSCKIISGIYGVSDTAISYITNRQTYKHVED
jgi:hypothetical protein